MVIQGSKTMVAKSSGGNGAPRFWCYPEKKRRWNLRVQLHFSKSNPGTSGFSFTFRKVALEPQGLASLFEKQPWNLRVQLHFSKSSPGTISRSELRHLFKVFPSTISSGYGGDSFSCDYVLSSLRSLHS